MFFSFYREEKRSVRKLPMKDTRFYVFRELYFFGIETWLLLLYQNYMDVIGSLFVCR